MKVQRNMEVGTRHPGASHTGGGGLCWGEQQARNGVGFWKGSSEGLACCGLLRTALEFRLLYFLEVGCLS